MSVMALMRFSLALAGLATGAGWVGDPLGRIAPTRTYRGGNRLCAAGVHEFVARGAVVGLTRASNASRAAEPDSRQDEPMSIAAAEDAAEVRR